MIVNQKPSGIAKSVPAGIAIGWALQTILMVLLCAGAAALFLSGKMARENIGYYTMVILLVSSYVGATISCRAIKHRKLLVCALSAVAFMVTLLAITALFFDGQYEAVGVTALQVFGGCAVAALMNTTKKSERKHRGRGRKL